MSRSDICGFGCINKNAARKAKSALPENKVILKAANCFKILGDPTRARILCALSKTEMCVCDLSALLGMEHSAVSHQLRVLRDINMVKFRREGKSVYYSLSDEHAIKLIGMGIRHAKE